MMTTVTTTTTTVFPLRLKLPVMLRNVPIWIVFNLGSSDASSTSIPLIVTTFALSACTGPSISTVAALVAGPGRLETTVATSMPPGMKLPLARKKSPTLITFSIGSSGATWIEMSKTTTTFTLMAWIGPSTTTIVTLLLIEVGAGVGGVPDAAVVGDGVGVGIWLTTILIEITMIVWVESSTLQMMVIFVPTSCADGNATPLARW